MFGTTDSKTTSQWWSSAQWLLKPKIAFFDYWRRYEGIEKKLHNPRCNVIRKHNPRCNIIRKWLSVGRSVAYYVNIISPHFFFKVRIGTVPTPAILPSHIGYAPLDLPYNCRVALCRERDKRRPPRWHAHFWNQCCEVDNLSCFRGIYLIFKKNRFFSFDKCAFGTLSIDHDMFNDVFKTRFH